MIKAPLPETNHLLLEESSQAPASGGRKAIMLLVEIQRLANGVGLDGEVPLLVDQMRSERLEEGAGGIDVVTGLAEPDAEGKSRLLQASAAFRNVSRFQLSAWVPGRPDT